jgi:hypothetical protein
MGRGTPANPLVSEAEETIVRDVEGPGQMNDLNLEQRVQRLEELVYRLSKVLNLAGSLLRISSVLETMSKDQGER